MPRKTKEIIEEKDNKKKTVKRNTTSKKDVSKKATKNENKNKKSSTEKKVESRKTANKRKKVVEKKAPNKKATTKKSVASTEKKNTRKSKTFKPEYYDLPYVYNQTVIKLLAQTPKNIFVYWEISETDVNNFIKKYGNDFFNNTIPVLSVYNEDKNYYFDININDYANSWYINVPDESCKYRVTLKRVFKEQTSSTPSFVEIATSNEIINPNGHVLFDSISERVEYMNLQTKNKYFKIFANRNKNFANKFYNNYIEKFGLNNPSSNLGRF
mgnify:CR=1 FL=1